MNNICRFCLRGGVLSSIFSSERDLQISFKVMSLSTVQISEDDNLPGVVCDNCLKKINNSYEFKIQCEQADLKLRQKLFDDPDFSKFTEHIIGETNSASYLGLNSFSKSDIIFEIKLENETKVNDTETARTSNTRLLLEPNEYNKLQRIETKVENIPKNRSKKKRHSVKMENVKHIEKLKKFKNAYDEKCDLSKTKRDPVPSSTQCYTCGKLVSSRFRLKCHMRIHTGEKPYSCQYCNKDFTLAYNLKVHERIHTGEKPLVCKICGKTFAQSAGLVAHSRLHTGETPYKCNLCPMQFKTCSHLQYHVRLHTGEKNFECEICNRAFITKGDLTQHHKTHTGERTHVCAVCGLRLTRSYHLTRHMLTHTGEKPHRCSICGTAYAQKGDLVRHLKKHDSDNHRHGLTNQPNNNKEEIINKGNVKLEMNYLASNTLESAPQSSPNDSRLFNDSRTTLGLGIGLNLFQQLV